MAGVTYKCPSCGAYLNFDPDTQRWQCPFCTSSYEEKELLEKAAAYQQAAEQEAQAAQQTSADKDGQQVVYHCPSCGSEIMTDETTVATQCYYCHNPVVLQGKLTAEMKPDEVLPFTVGKEKAVERFMAWVKKKRFVPHGFFDQAQVASMSGVYYPHFVTECTLEGDFNGEGSNSSVADLGKYIVTTTQHYQVRRKGLLTFRDIIRPALNKANRKLSDGIHPFPLDTAKPFSGAYLSGFLAERRDIDAQTVQQDVTGEAADYAQPLLTDNMPYATYHGNTSTTVKDVHSKYILLPTWVLTYPNKHDPQNPYYYAMNGCTGETCGKLPLNKQKLWLTGLGIAAAVFAACCVCSYLFF